MVQQLTCSACGNVSNGLETMCVHQRRIALDMLDEMKERYAPDDFDQEVMASEYEDWAAVHPQEAEELHQRLTKLVQDALDKVRRSDA